MPAAAPDDPDNPGLAEERTELAWNRSVLAAVVMVATLMKRSWDRLETAGARAVGLVCVAVAAAAWFTAVLQAARSTARRSPEWRVSQASLRRMTIGTVAFAAAGLALSVGW